MPVSLLQIKKSYRKAALVCHPDKNPDNPKAAVEFVRLQKILKILLDPGKIAVAVELLIVNSYLTLCS